MPTEQLEDGIKKRKLEDVSTTNNDEEAAKEPEVKKLATDDGGEDDTTKVMDEDGDAGESKAKAKASTTRAASNEDDADTPAVSEAQDNGTVGKKTKEDQQGAAEASATRDDQEGDAKTSTTATNATTPSEDTTDAPKAADADATKEDKEPKEDATSKDKTEGDSEKNATAATAEDDDEVIVVATKTSANSASVAAVVAAAAAATPDHANNKDAINSIVHAATGNTPNGIINTSHHLNGSSSSPPPSIENLPFPKLDEASMSGMSQSERKRYREKKRRSEITQAIDKLTKILLKVEPANLFSQNNLVYSTNTTDLIPSRSGGRAGGSGQQPLNRTEIINHAVKVLEKLHSENEERKMQLMRLHTVVTDAGAAVAGSQPAMMMMPAQPMIYQATPQAKMQTAAFANATAIPVQTIQMQHPTSFMQTATAYHVPSAGAPVDTMPQGMVMVPAPGAPGAAATGVAPSHIVPVDAGQQQRAFEQFYLSQQLQQQQRMRESR